MKKQLIFCCVLVTQLFTLCAYANQDRLLIAGSIQFPTSVSKPPSLKVLYQGYKYPVEVSCEAQRAIQKGHFEFYVDPSCKELYILVAENLQRPDQNNFDHLKTSSDYSYRLFKLTKQKLVVKDEPLKLTWAIEEISHENQEIILPDNTLILFMPPSMIAKLEEEPWLADQHVVRLPRIVFDEDITEQELQDAATRMTLALLDFELFHVALPKRHMISGNRIVAIPYLQHSKRA